MRAHHNINVAVAAATTSTAGPSCTTSSEDSLLPNTLKTIEDGTNNILLSPYSNVRAITSSTLDPDTDSLGFYLSSPRTRSQTPLAIMLMHVSN